MNSHVIVGAVNHETNQYDGNTIEAVIDKIEKNRQVLPKELIGDRGYRGRKKVKGVQISLPGVPKKKDTEQQKNEKRKKFRKRAGIEPVIGHLKSDFRLCRNWLKGKLGDHINVLMACCAWNLKKWMREAILCLALKSWKVFIKKYVLILHFFDSSEKIVQKNQFLKAQKFNNFELYSQNPVFQ